MSAEATRDHGGNLDAAIARFGGKRSEWLDLSTGINPEPYPIPSLNADLWQALPDQNLSTAIEKAARAFWTIPDSAAVLAAPGASSLIARIPSFASGTVCIPSPTYNEHAAAFDANGWKITEDAAVAQVLVHPNNPDGKQWGPADITVGLTIIDESFCDVLPEGSLVSHTARPGVLVLKSFGKFWGLAGLRLGFAIGDPKLIKQLETSLGPWPVSGPALCIGAQALSDMEWAQMTRARLQKDALRLDQKMATLGAELVGGTSLFRLYDVEDAAALQTRLAENKIWSRIFPYSRRWLRLGLPHPNRWSQLDRL